LGSNASKTIMVAVAAVDSRQRSTRLFGVFYRAFQNRATFGQSLNESFGSICWHGLWRELPDLLSLSPCPEKDWKPEG
jgi:hypothetical protein